MPLTTKRQPASKYMIWIGSLGLVLIGTLVLVLALKNVSQGSIAIKSDLTPTTISINGKQAGTAPIISELAYGHYKIIAKFQQSQQVKEIDLAKQEKIIVFFNFNSPDSPEKIQNAQQLDNLVTETDRYTIDISDKSGFDLSITLHATYNHGLNGPPIEEQWADYQKELKQYKQEALDWIKSKNVDPAKLKIEWAPAGVENI